MQTRSLSRSQLLPAWLIFLLRRLLFIAGVAFVIVYFCILGLRLSFHSATSDSTLHRTWELAGPTLKETGAFFGNLWRGELGYVYEGVLERTRLPVMAMVIDAYRQSMWLLLVSIAAAAVIGIVAGGLAAARRHTPLALPTLTLTVIGISIPSFFLALLFRVADIRFYQRTGIGLFPVFGISEHRTASLLPQVVAPALVLAARPVAHIARVTFVSLSDILGQEFIRTARAKGVHPTAVFWKHGVRNAGVSILTALVVSLRFALGSLPVVEIFFQWPGMGVATLEGIFRRDTAAVPALALALGITLMLINLGLGMVYRFIDPRLRAETDGGAA
ncbi:MAG: ABC transporter permease [Anaerolineae bacterium]